MEQTKNIQIKQNQKLNSVDLSDTTGRNFIQSNITTKDIILNVVVLNGIIEVVVYSRTDIKVKTNNKVKVVNFKEEGQ